MSDLQFDTEAGLIEELRFHGLVPPREVKTLPATPKGRHVDLKPHQQKAVEELENGNILIGGVGTGKSRTAAAYARLKEPARDVVVITTAKKRDSLDWFHEFMLFGVGRTADATLTETTVQVDSWNNLDKYVDCEGLFFIFDEQRLVGKGAWTKAFLKIARRNRWILLSATPGDTWLDYIPVFIANGFYRTRTEFTREHVVYASWSKFPKVERYLGEPKLLRLRKSIQVEMPYDRHTVRHVHNLLVGHDTDLLKRVVSDRWHVYEERPIRDVAELFSVMRKVVNSDPSRLAAVQELLEKHPKLIVFYNFNYELEALRTLSKPQSSNNSFHSSSSTSTGTPSQSPSGSTRNPSSKTPSTTSTYGRTEPWPTPTPAGTTSSDKTSPTSATASAAGPGSPRRSTPPRTTSTASTPMSGSTTENPPGVVEVSNGIWSGVTSHRLQTHPSPSSEPSCKEETSTFEVAEWNGHKHQPIPETDSWVYLVQYVAGSEGWNCIDTDAMAFYSMTYSYKNWAQAYGRIDRLNTPYTDLHYYVLKSNSAIDIAISKSLKLKKSFNEKDMGIKI